MISTAPNWHRPQSGCQEATSHFGAVETNYSTSDDDWSTGVLIILKGNADVNVSVVAQNLVKMAGRSFGREKNYGLTVIGSSGPW